MKLFINENTPVEIYQVKGRTVYVKRDDLMGDNNVMPPWGKIGAINNLVTNYVDKSKPLTHLSVNGSWSGWALAGICDSLGIEFHYAYPDAKNFNRAILDHVKSLYPNTQFLPMKPNMMAVLYNRLKSTAVKNEWQLLPYAFDHIYYKSYMANRLINTLNTIGVEISNLVVSSGAGVSVAGLATGFFGRSNFNEWPPKQIDANKKVYTTAVSSIKSVSGKLKENAIVGENIRVRKSEFAFSDRMNEYQVPFPINQFWDIKQWHWLENNIEEIEGEVLFWNLGGIFSF
jgi:hypothetical protein